MLFLFVLNLVLNRQETVYQMEKLDERKEVAETILAGIYAGEYDEFPNIKQQTLKETQQELSVIESFREGEWLDYLSHENNMFINYDRLGIYFDKKQQQDPLEEYGFYPAQYAEGKKVLNDTLIQKQEPFDSIRYGTKATTFVVSASLYVTSFIGVLYFFLLFVFLI